MPEEPIADKDLIPNVTKLQIMDADAQADQKIYVELRAKGYTDHYISDNSLKLGFSKHRPLTTIKDWRRKLREALREAYKEELVETAAELGVATVHRVGGLAWVLNKMMEEIKRRATDEEAAGFQSMDMDKLLKEYRATSLALGSTLRPYENDVLEKEQTNVYLNFFQKISDPVAEVVDGSWSPAEDG